MAALQVEEQINLGSEYQNTSGIPLPPIASKLWREQDVGKLAQEAYFISKRRGFTETPPKFAHCLPWANKRPQTAQEEAAAPGPAGLRRRRGRGALASSLSLGSAFVISALWRM